MEYIQAFLFTSKYILGRNGNTDIFYIFAVFVLLFYLWKRRDKFFLIIKIMIPFAVMCLAMALFYPWSSALRCGIFFGKMLCNITLMIFVAYNCNKWKIIRFVEVIVWIHAVETIIALIYPNSSLWMVENSGTDVMISRLRLFYIDSGSMAFICGLVLVLLVYQLLTEEVIWRQIVGVAIMIYDLFLSYGLGGVGCAAIAIVVMLFMAAHEKKQSINVKIYIFGAGIAFLASAVLMSLNSIYAGKIKGILNGTNYNFRHKLLDPILNISNVLHATKFLGVGFGNANSVFSLGLMNSVKAYPNSFLRIIAEGGIFGIGLIFFIVGLLIYYCYKYGNIIDKALCLYIVIYQMTGGYFTDPTNFFIYGWIMGDCIRNKITATGACRIKLFMPTRKEFLKIAMIGHKRIPSREGGVEVVVEEISTRLVKMGNQVDAYNRSGQHVSGQQYNLADYDKLGEYKGIKIIKIPTIQKKGLAALVYSLIASVIVVGKDYDVVHYHAEGPCAFIWIPSLFGIRTVATIHGLDWCRNGKWGSAASKFIKLGERMAVEFADEIIVLSRNVQRYFLDNYNRKTSFIPNGINRPLQREANIIKEEWNIDRDGYILFLARITKEKGVHYLIEAYKQINTDKKLVIAGGASDSGEYMKELKELAADDERIIFTGFVQGETLDELYSNAYIYCLPSDIEGMPISLLEAMSYGNCCLVSDIPECTEVAGVNAYTFEQGNIQDLRMKIEELLGDQLIVNGSKSKSSDYVCTKYQWNNVVEKTVGLYRDKDFFETV